MRTRSEQRQRSLERAFHKAPNVSLDREDRYVIFSDLHMGDGSWTDDFRRNSRMFESVLNRHYFREDYSLILNGDVEELQRFNRPAILRTYPNIFGVFDEFAARHRLIRILGNHDWYNFGKALDISGRPTLEAVRLSYGQHTMFVLHGHQALWAYDRMNRIIGYALKYALNPLKIRNRTVAHDSRKRFITEKRVYEFSLRHGILSIIGHTHRPLFESMSKVDSIRFEIEQLCRAYPASAPTQRSEIEQRVSVLQQSLERIHARDRAERGRRSLYNADLIVPSLFNSGCVLGKRGMTALEIENGTLSLVHWFEGEKEQKYFSDPEYTPMPLPGTDFYRVVLKRDSLDYIFSRIGLLTGTLNGKHSDD